MILKKDWDELEASSYEHVSLLPNESKLISKLLANHLKKYIQTIEYPDQTCFIPNRHILFSL